MNRLRTQIESLLAEYAGSELAKNIGKPGTPEYTFINQVMDAVRKQYGECGHKETITMVNCDGRKIEKCIKCGGDKEVNNV